MKVSLSLSTSFRKLFFLQISNRNNININQCGVIKLYCFVIFRTQTIVFFGTNINTKTRGVFSAIQFWSLQTTFTLRTFVRLIVKVIERSLLSSQTAYISLFLFKIERTYVTYHLCDAGGRFCWVGGWLD